MEGNGADIAKIWNMHTDGVVSALDCIKPQCM